MKGWFRAALLAPANLVGLGTTVGASLATGHSLPVVVALAAEAAYLGLVGLVPSLRRSLPIRRSSGVDDELEARLADLAESQREHYAVLRDLKDKVLDNYRKLPGGGVLAASSEPRIDALLTAFVRLLSTLNDQRRYLGIADRDALQRELKGLEDALAHETNARLRDVQEKRAEILRRRLQRFAQAEESRAVVSHQLAGIEELMRLTHEQSIAIRDPASVGQTLEALAAEVDASEETVRELERFRDVTEDAGLGTSSRSRVRA